MKVRQTVVNYSIENEPYVAVVVHVTDLSLLDFVKEVSERDSIEGFKVWSDTKIELIRNNASRNVVVFEVISDDPLTFTAESDIWAKEKIIDYLAVGHITDQFDDISDEDCQYLKELIVETATNEDCQEFVELFSDYKDVALHEDWFADKISELNVKFVNRILERSDKFQAFKLLRT